MARSNIPFHMDGKEYRAGDGSSTRAEAHAAGAAARPGEHRRQMQSVNRGEKIKHKLAGTASRKSGSKNQSTANDARAIYGLNK